MRDLITLTEKLNGQATVLKDGRHVTIHHFEEDDCIQLFAIFDSEQVAEASFEPDRGYFRRIDVERSFRRVGLASAMYDYVAEMGYLISPSPFQQPDGVSFWNSGNNPRSRQ